MLKEGGLFLCTTKDHFSKEIFANLLSKLHADRGSKTFMCAMGGQFEVYF